MSLRVSVLELEASKAALERDEVAALDGRCNSLRCKIPLQSATVCWLGGVWDDYQRMMLRQIIYRDFLINIHHYLDYGSPEMGNAMPYMYKLGGG